MQSERTNFPQAVARRARAGTTPQVEPWDLVYFDPPYATDYLGVLKLFGEQTESLLAESGLLIVEHHHKTDLPGQVGTITRQRVLKQGDSVLRFYSAVRI